ncbi:hypothetical protein GGI07_004923 [Coemansia sp. Benny D115]|nr:hypothetical protein GGI07_004923 [Coemansia sp. Benny D115]
MESSFLLNGGPGDILSKQAPGAKDTDTERQTVLWKLERLLQHSDSRLGIQQAQSLARILLGEEQLSDREEHKAEAATDSIRDQQPAWENSIASNSGDWDISALKELADTGRVAGALEQQQTHLQSPTSTAESPTEVASVYAKNVDRQQRFMIYAPSSGVQQTDQLDEAIRATQGELANEGFVWLDITDPTAVDTAALASAFGLHPLTAEDALAEDNNTRDKFERVADHGYALLLYHTLEAGPLVMVVRPDSILTFRTAQADVHVRNALLRLLGRPAGASSAAFVAYALVDDVTDHLSESMRQVEQDVQRVDVLVMQGTADKAAMLLQIGSVRRRLLALWRAALHKPDVVRALVRAVQCPGEEEADGLAHYLADVLDHLCGLLSLCAQCEMMLSRAHANYMAQLSLRQSESTVGVGVFSNRWLVVAGVLLPMQFGATLFGQNVHVPWMSVEDKGAENNVHAWLGIFCTMFGACLCAMAVLRYRGSL